MDLSVKLTDCLNFLTYLHTFYVSMCYIKKRTALCFFPLAKQCNASYHKIQTVIIS